jgi:predicted Zn-dependent peptidase
MISTKINQLDTFIDTVPHVETVSIAFGVKSGSCDESEKNNGISHFLEHMAFKGTAKRDYLEIAKIIDNAGGYINAYTAKDRTVYYVKLMKNDLELGVDVISDIVQNSIFPEKEIEKERGVILQELSATLDSPDDVVFDNFYRDAFGENTSLGRTILGPKENIEKLQKNDFQSYIDSRYSTQNSCLAISGNVDQSKTSDIIDKYFSNLKTFTPSDSPKDQYSGGSSITHKEDLQQVQCVLGFKSEQYTSENKYAIGILSSILGGGMSSRLFREIREERGLAYTVSSFNDTYENTGLFGVYAGTSPDKVDEFLTATIDELKKISDGITDEEMSRVIKQTQSGIAMSNESTNSRSQKLITDNLHLGRVVEYSEIMEKIQNVTKQDIINLAQSIFKSKPTLTIYGNTKGIKSTYESFCNALAI